MTASVRERLITAIVAAVHGDYGISVPEDPRDLPLVVVQDEPDVATANYDYTACSMPITIARAESPEDGTRTQLRIRCHELLTWIITTMHADETFGGLAQGIDYKGGGIQAEAGKYVFAQASFTVRYQHLRGNPAQT